MTLNQITTLAIVAIVIAILAIVLAVWAVFELRKIRRLKSKFGPEYDRVVQNEGDLRHAQTILENREKRVSRYHVRLLTPQEIERFAIEWRNVQEQFVDDPRMALSRADQLINEAMKARGYPISDFEAQAADLSVDYPAVVEHYRAAHAIDLRRSNGQVDTEELRKAMRHYHALFEKVIESGTSNHQEEAR
jgi:hypothetical protein